MSPAAYNPGMLDSHLSLIGTSPSDLFSAQPTGTPIAAKVARYAVPPASVKKIVETYYFFRQNQSFAHNTIF